MRTVLLTLLAMPAVVQAQADAQLTTDQLFKSIAMWIPTDYDTASEAGTHLKQGVELFRTNRIVASANQFIAARHTDPRLPGHDFWLATMIASLGRFDQTYDYLNRAIQSAPDDPRVWGLYAIIEFKQRRYGATLALLDKADALLKSPPLDAAFAARCRYQLLSVRGRTCDLFGMWNEALTCFQELSALEPDPVFFLASAKMLSRLGREQEALDILHNTAFKERYGGTAESFMANWSAEQGAFDTAATWYARAIAAAPDDATVAYNNGLNLRALGRYDEAYAEFERSAALGYADLADVEMQKGYVSFAQGRFDTAEQHFAIVHGAAPDSTLAATYYALSLIERDDPTKQALAATLAQRLVQRQGASFGDAGTASWIDYRRGQRDSALKSIDVAMSNPDDNTVYFRAAMYHDLGQDTAALELLDLICERSGMFVYRDSARRLRDGIRAAPAAQEAAP